MSAGSVGIANNTYGLFYEPIAQLFNTGRGPVAFHMTVSTMVFGFTGPAVAWLAKKIRLNWIIAAGIAIYFSAGMVIANAPSLTVMNIAGFFRGLGLACISTLTFTMLLGNWFHQYRGTITGFTLAFSGVMGAIYSPILSRLLISQGLKTSYIISFSLVCLLAMPAMFAASKPEYLGLKPLGEGYREEKKKTVQYDLPLKKVSLLFLLTALTGCLSTSMTTVVSYVPSLAQSFGHDSLFGANMLSTSMIGNIVFKLIIGVLIDRLNIFASFRIMMFIATIGVSGALLLHQHTLLFGLGIFLHAAAFSANTVGVSMLARTIYGDENYGQAYGSIIVATNLVRSAALTLIGTMFDITGSYVLPFSLAAVAGVLSNVTVLLILTIIRKEQKNV